MKIMWKTLGDAWNDEHDSRIPEISANDLHALGLWLTGDPSPRGYRTFAIERLSAIADGTAAAPTELALYRNVAADGNEREAARWALKILKK